METQSLPETPLIERHVSVTSSDDVSDVLRDANETNKPVIPVGGGTSLHTGNATGEAFIAVDMTGLSGLREYHPTDLTASFWAGTTLADVQAALGEHGQELPIDMARIQTATIGGMVATGFAGPRRLGSGTLKDLIIGYEYVRGDGLVAKAGGMLVKNVSGFEIPRFLHGSWGSLAVISSINLKVIPKPKADVTFVHAEGTLTSSLEGQLAILREHPGVMAAVSEKADNGWTMSVRVMGRPSSIEAQLASFRDRLGRDTETREGGDHWGLYSERWAGGDPVARLVISGRAAALHALALKLDDVDGVIEMAVSLGTGMLRVGVDPSVLPRSELESRFAGQKVSWVIESAPASWSGTSSVWGAPREDRALVQAIKDQFDPAHVLNRGRLFI